MEPKMEAGRYLDALVAEKVMGLETYGEMVPFCPECEYQFNPKSPGRMWCHNCGEWVYSSTKPYSTDISAAWEIVEKLREIKICLSISHVWEHFKHWKYFVTIQRIGEEAFYVEPQDTAPHAIALAALKAVEGK